MDGVSNYIDWAVEKGFGVMDINVPGYKAPPDEVMYDFSNAGFFINTSRFSMKALTV